MTRTTFAAMRKIFVSVLGAISIVAIVAAIMLFDSVAYAASDRYDVTATVRNISPGVNETEYYTNTTENNDQVVARAITVDLSQKNTLIAGYKDYDTSGKWGMQSVREQAAAAESARGVNVVAAVNGDFYNMGTGQPTGVLVMGGKVVNDAAGRNYFAILKDGTAVIRTGSLQGDEAEALGGDLMLIRDGEIAAVGNDSYYTTKQPRTAVGVTAKGQVVIVVADGRQSPYSSGYTYAELAEKMFELGCVDAINLDGGGSTTYLAKYAGTDELTLANSPSDGQERSVSSSLMVVSKAEPTGIFASAEITPNNEVYTPGSAVEFTAIGADTAGFGMDIPEGAYWQVSTESEVSGEITDMPSEADGEMAAQFVADEGQTGKATIELVYEGSVVGSAQIELQWPDTLIMENSRFSLDFSEETDFGIEAHWKTRVVHLKAGDLVWDIGPTGNEEFPSIGQMNGDIFVADAEATNVTATVTAKLAHDESVKVSAEVSVGQLPYVLWDFEDVTDEEGNVIETAEEHYSFGEGGDFSITTTNKGEVASAQIVDTSNGEVRVGEHALQINYDFTNAQRNATLGIYFGTSEYFDMPNEFGMPTAFGVWIYVPTEGFNYWLRTWFTGHDEDGTQMPGNSFGSGFGGNFNENDGVALAQGWNYIYVDFSEANSYGVSYYRFGNQMFRIMLVGPSGTYTKGYIYLDNFQFEYGPNTDDLFAPEINSVSLNSESGMALSETEVTDISDDPFYIYASYEEFMGLSDDELAEIEDEEQRERYEKASMYATGVNTGNIHVYVDGNEVELGSVSETYLLTSAISLPNGKHEITVEVYDNFQNLATKSYVVNVVNDSEYAAVSLVPQGGMPYLGSDYALELVADRPEIVDIVTFEIRLGGGLILSDCTDIAEGFEVTECELVHKNNNIYRVTLERKEGAAADVGLLAVININCPTTLVQGSVFSYSIESSEVIYTDGFQSEIFNSFYEENVGEDVLSYYTISADLMIVGSKDGGYIYVTDPNGAPAVGVDITIDGVFAGKTNEQGRLFTTVFTEAQVTKTVAASSDMGYSFGQSISGVLPGGAQKEDGSPSAAPVFVRSVATVNGNTEQRIVWLVNPLSVGEEDKAYVKYAVKADYEAKGEQAFKTLTGESALLDFVDGYAVRVNTALIAGLEQDTEYVYVVGDGANWSELHSFSTAKKDGETNFFIIGDTQEDNPEAIQAYGEAINNSGIDYDFAIQTGDFVDSGGRYSLWSGILSMFTEYFSDVDIVQVFGNHEYEGSEGEYPTAMNFVPDSDYYSVTYGNVYVAVINVYSVEDMQEAIEWIKADAAKSDALWKVLTLHRPPYYTNPSGGSDMSHDLIPALVDEAGFDVVFSGHDHSFARTEPLTGGEIDKENGAVYYIVGAAESGRYGVTENPDFHFAKTSKDNGFNALYFSVSASYTKMEIIVYNLLSDGSGFEIYDSYTITNDCHPDNHEYYYDTATDMLVCERCHYSVLPEEVSFSGLITDTEGRNMFFTAGEMQTGWIPIGEEFYYFGEDGRGVNGNVVVQSSYDGNDCGSITFLFENGKKIGGYTGWYGEKYYIDGEFQTGFIELDGKIYYLWTSEDNRWTGYELGQRARGYRQIAFHTEWGWTWDTFFWFDETDGHMLGEAYDEDGNMMPGKFYNRVVNGKNLYSYVIIEGTGQNITSDLYRNGWIVANEYAGEAEGSVYYILWDNMILGDYEIEGVTYKFNDAGTDPLTDGTGALLGRYYSIQFVSDGETLSQMLVFEGEKITAPESPEKQGNSIKTYTFVGWFNGENELESTSVATADATYIAKFDTVYTETYNNVIKLLAALAEADTPEEKHLAVNAMDAAYKALSQAQIVDMRAEGVSFALYEEMLSKIYTVTFVVEGNMVDTAVLYEGEEITAPESPEKQGNSIKTYKFVGWFNGDEQLAEGATAEGDVTYTAKFEAVYNDIYAETVDMFDDLLAVDVPAQKRIMLEKFNAYYNGLTEEQIADLRAEGLPFDVYEDMLSKLYTVTFVADGQTVVSTALYEGEAISAPESPAKAGNSIKAYEFTGWYNGELAFEEGALATGSVTYEARYSTVYTQEYVAVAAALGELASVAGGTLEERYTALSAIYGLMKTFSEENIADAEAEGLSFAAYNELLAAYNATAQGAAEDLKKAESLADNIMNAAAAVSLFAAAAYVGRRFV